MLFRYSADKNGKLNKKAVIYTKEEHGIQLKNIDTDALHIISRLKDAGFPAYIVGGAVRDLIIGKIPKDFDIVTDATPSRIKRIFRNSRVIGRRFKLVHVFFGSKIFEVSTFRSIVGGSVGNNFGTIDEDVMRRDFTLNALYYDCSKQQVIDYVGGLRDIKKGIIRSVISLDHIFIDDPVRMLRAIKYSAMTECKLPFLLQKKIKQSAHLLSPISPSRLTEEILKIINSGYAKEIVSKAIEMDVYTYIQPAAALLMHKNAAFKEKYMQHLGELDALTKTNAEVRLGKKLRFIICDFVAEMDICKMKAENQSASDIYANAWNDCRAFVLPMNPQRSELEYAVLSLLLEAGVSAKSATKRKRH